MRTLFLGCFLVACSATAPVQIDAGPGDAGAAPDTSVVVPACGALGAPIKVIANDEYGYPPYSMHGCRLAYVDSISGNLVLRNLSDGNESTLETAASSPRRPVVASDAIAWEATVGTAKVVRVLYNNQTSTIQVPNYTDLGEPAAAAGIVVFTAFKTNAFDSDTDVFAYDAATGVVSPIATGPKQQRFAAVSDSIIAVTDFVEDPVGVFNGTGNDLADIGVYDRKAKNYTVRQHPGKDAFPAIVSGDVLAYLHWGDVHPEPKLEAYSVYTARINGAPSTDTRIADVQNSLRYIRPSASSGQIEWVTSFSGNSSLWRSDLKAAPVSALNVTSETLLGSVSLESGTLIARNGALVVIAR